MKKNKEDELVEVIVRRDPSGKNAHFSEPIFVITNRRSKIIKELRKFKDIDTTKK